MPFEQSRRDALRLAGVTAGFSLAGCLSNISLSRQPRHLGESASVERGAVTVDDVEVQQTLVYLLGSAHPSVHGEAGTQYAVVDVSSDSIDDLHRTARDALRVYFDSERYEWSGVTLVRNMEEENAASLAFSVPTDASVTEGRVDWVDESGDAAASWKISGGTADRLSNPPEFSVVSFDAPQSAENGDRIEATVKVRNEGGTDGLFRAELGFHSLSGRPIFHTIVPPDQTVVHTEQVEVHSGPGTEDTLGLHWGRGSLTRTVQVEE